MERVVGAVAKPPYSIPSMAEIAAIETNGLDVVSTFSGCGGSCLGFRQAGYRTLWASEFVPAAAETYRANFPDVPLSTDDIREIQPATLLTEIGRERGDVDVVEGSPPCASFSTAGKRSAHWGQVKPYSDVEQRVDDLFFEFVRIVEGIQPRVFVAENVAGLVRGVAKGYYLDVLKALEDAGYRVGARLLDAQWLGVPQVRRRVIFIGVRNDLEREPVFPKPLQYRYSVAEAIGLVAVGTKNGARSADLPAPTVQTHGRRKTQSELTAIESRKVGLQEDVGENVGASLDGYAIAPEWDKLRPGESSDRYFNLVRPDPERPLPTVTAMGVGGHKGVGSPGGVAAVTHPTERRKFAISELKRLCGFPADFVLTGTYQQRWERLGRAVPPPMMRAVAETIRDDLLAERERAA